MCAIVSGEASIFSRDCEFSKSQPQRYLKDSWIARCGDDPAEVAGLNNPTGRIGIQVADRIGEIRVVEEMKNSVRNSMLRDSRKWNGFTAAKSRLGDHQKAIRAANWNDLGPPEPNACDTRLVA